MLMDLGLCLGFVKYVFETINSDAWWSVKLDPAMTDEPTLTGSKINRWNCSSCLNCINQKVAAENLQSFNPEKHCQAQALTLALQGSISRLFSVKCQITELNTVELDTCLILMFFGAIKIFFHISSIFSSFVRFPNSLFADWSSTNC